MRNPPRTPEQKQQQRQQGYRFRRAARQFEYDALEAAAEQCDCQMRSDPSLPEGFWLEGVYIALEEPPANRDHHRQPLDVEYARRGVVDDVREVFAKIAGER